ncbi:MAG: SDR family NAD(P)-dependent oxidoreductase, partial [bacterium]|nr:SDR family NAD(P)-dependent oxidoreductase [bacterium]
MDGKVALVTGASGGIGMATLRRLAGEGAAVVGVDLADESGEKLVAELTEGGAQAVYQHCDVCSLEEVTAAVERAVSEFGRIDVLFNNAATSTGGYIPDLDAEGWDSSLRVMLTAAMYGMKAAI